MTLCVTVFLLIGFLSRLISSAASVSRDAGHALATSSHDEPSMLGPIEISNKSISSPSLGMIPDRNHEFQWPRTWPFVYHHGPDHQLPDASAEFKLHFDHAGRNPGWGQHQLCREAFTTFVVEVWEGAAHREIPTTVRYSPQELYLDMWWHFTEAERPKFNTGRSILIMIAGLSSSARCRSFSVRVELRNQLAPIQGELPEYVHFADFVLNVHDGPVGPPSRWPHPSRFPFDMPITGKPGDPAASLRFHAHIDNEYHVRTSPDAIGTKMQTRLLVMAHASAFRRQPQDSWHHDVDRPPDPKMWEDRARSMVLWVDGEDSLTNALVARALYTLWHLVQQRGMISCFMEIWCDGRPEGSVMMHISEG